LTAYAYSSGEPNNLEDWQPGALVVVPYTFSVPDDLAYIKVQGVDERGELAADGRTYLLPLHVAAQSPAGTNFGGVIRLRDHTYVGTGAQRPVYSPGATVHLTLEWEALRPIGEAYKVFVHVLGPNGLPVTQQDNEPVKGTYPTTHWQRGERIVDSYAIRLPDDLPPGEYPVEVGLYRISDLSRLPVLDKEQSVVDDKVFLRPLTVK
jgi:hypothetical protein